MSRAAAPQGADLDWAAVGSTEEQLVPDLLAAAAERGGGPERVLQVHVLAGDADLGRIGRQLHAAFRGVPPPCHLVQQPPASPHSVAALLWLGRAPVVRGPTATSMATGPGALFFLDPPASGSPAPVGVRWRDCFAGLERGLAAAGLAMRDVVKLWTYYGGGSCAAEHFAEFSACRNAVLDRCRFAIAPDRGGRGLPASTGVAVAAGPALLGAVAARGLVARALSNPLQADPHAYGPPLQPALFSRAVRLALGDRALVLASGTASVVGSTVAAEGDAPAQTRQVLALLDALVGDPSARFGYLLAHVRNAADAPAVRAELARRHPEVPTVVVQAELSRPALLVEVDSAVLVPAPPTREGE